MMWSTSEGSNHAISSARRAATTARSDEASPAATMRRSWMPVRSRIHSSDVSTIFSRSKLVITPSGTCIPVPTMVAPRTSSGGFTVRLDFFPNVLVHALLHERDHGTNRTPNRLGPTAAVTDEAHPVHAEQRGRRMLLPVELPHQAAQGGPHQQGAQRRQGITRDFGT